MIDWRKNRPGLNLHIWKPQGQKFLLRLEAFSSRRLGQARCWRASSTNFGMMLAGYWRRFGFPAISRRQKQSRGADIRFEPESLHCLLHLPPTHIVLGAAAGQRPPVGPLPVAFMEAGQ